MEADASSASKACTSFGCGTFILPSGFTPRLRNSWFQLKCGAKFLQRGKIHRMIQRLRIA